VVRRSKQGARPFIWEINQESAVEPLLVSVESFVSMEAAYKAGEARLAEFVPASRSIPKMVANDTWP
jgi:hypothetical protein